MIRTRFAPSPTGFLHIGGARTALFSWAFARHHGGKFVLRIEDTDVARSTPEAVKAIIDGMNWLGLEHDEGPFYQMQRMDRYKEVIRQMLASGAAYYCYTTPEELESMREAQRAKGVKPRYDGTWRPDPGKVLPQRPAGVQPVIRFRNPVDGVVAWDDLVKGRIEIANAELDDLVIARADLTPTYNFCVVVDDWEMGITHVIRGDDHVNNTPRQINIYKALNAPVPEFAHVSMILGDDGAKLSKRHGAVSVMQYRDDGYLPEALLNYLVRLGWSHGDQEIFTLDEMIKLFSLDAISKSASAFNTDKLLWLNNHYMRSLDPAYVAKHLAWHMEHQQIDTSNGPALADVVTLLAERCNTLVEMAAQSRYLFEEYEAIDEAAAKKHLRGVAAEPLTLAKAKLAALETWTTEALHELIEATAAELGQGMGKVGMPLRVAVTGLGQSPAIDAVMALVGKERVLARIDRALAYIEARMAAE